MPPDQCHQGDAANVANGAFYYLASRDTGERVDVQAAVGPCDAGFLNADYYRDGMTPVEYCAAIIAAVARGDRWVFDTRLDALDEIDSVGMFDDDDFVRYVLDPFLRTHDVDRNGPWYLAGDPWLFVERPDVGICVLYHGDLPGVPVGWSAYEPQ